MTATPQQPPQRQSKLDNVIYLHHWRHGAPQSGQSCGGARREQPLFEAPARWSPLRPLPDSYEVRGPRHQTLRRRGSAPRYPKPSELANAAAGRLQIYRHGLALMSDEDDGLSAFFLPRQIASRMFYRDSMALVTETNARIVIGLDPADAEVVDVLCQAYL